MLLRPDSADIVDNLTDSAFGLILEGGCQALTLRRLGRRTGYSHSWLMDRFTNKARLLSIIAIVFERRWRAWVEHRLLREGLLALLPSNDHEVEGTRVLLGLAELARSQQLVAYHVDSLRRFERDLVVRQLPPTVDPLTIDAVVAMVEGLREGLGAVGRPLSPRQARSILAQHLAHLQRRHGRTPPPAPTTRVGPHGPGAPTGAGLPPAA